MGESWKTAVILGTALLAALGTIVAVLNLPIISGLVPH